MKTAFITLFILLCHFPLFPQIGQCVYMDLGKNNVSEGNFYRLASITGYKIKNYNAQTGFLGNFSYQNHNRFAGWFFNTTGNFMIKKIPIALGLSFRLNPFSDIIHETNWALTLGFKRNHVKIKIGDNLRIYKFSRSAIDQYKIQNKAGSKIIEPRNLMYSFTYFIKPIEHKWNATVSITNFDFFMIQQETNPLISCSFIYKTSKKLRFDVELWYQSAGLFNLHVNYFGYFFRIGISWQLWD